MNYPAYNTGELSYNTGELPCNTDELSYNTAEYDTESSHKYQVDMSYLP